MKMDHERSQHATSEVSTIAIDLEQVLSLPALTHGEMFYLRQLSCYNLGIHVGDNNKGTCFYGTRGALKETETREHHVFIKQSHVKYFTKRN